MNEKAAYLALNGFVVCQFAQHGGLRIKRQLRNEERQLQYLESDESWHRCFADDVDAYWERSWDIISNELWDKVSWEAIHKLITEDCV